MELTVTLDYGPLNAELSGEDRGEVEKNLLGLIEFLDENSEAFDGIEASEPRIQDSENPGIDSDYWEEKSNETEDENDAATARKGEEHPFESLARKTNSSTGVLDEIIYVDPDGEEEPQVLIDKSQLGDNKTARQRSAAYLILRIWEDCYGEERMKTSKLKSILTMSGISDVDLFHAWNGPGVGKFDSTGSGASATVGLTGPGKRKALKVMQELAEEQSN